MKRSVYIILLFLLFVLCSCNGKTYKTPEVREAINRNGPVEVPYIHEGDKVVMYYSAGGFAFAMEDVPHGKIDGIIRDNPKWQFIFYVYCKSDNEVAWVKSYLEAVGDDFAVRIDRNNAFKKANHMSEYDGIGFILDKDGYSLGMGVIGTSRSVFDSEFRKAKMRLGYE